MVYWIEPTPRRHSSFGSGNSIAPLNTFGYRNHKVWAVINCDADHRQRPSVSHADGARDAAAALKKSQNLPRLTNFGAAHPAASAEDTLKEETFHVDEIADPRRRGALTIFGSGRRDGEGGNR
jgi:hypothetical protein